MNGHGHDFGHEFVTESVPEADSDTEKRFLDFGHGLAHGLGQSHDFGHGHDFRHGHVRKPRTRKRTYACPLISVLATQSALV